MLHCTTLRASLKLLALLASATALFAEGPASDWKIAGPFGGTATAVAIDPKDKSTLLAGAMNSLLFQSTDGGANWRLLSLPKLDLSEVTSILIDPADTAHYFVGTIAAEGGGLFESRDRGKTWSLVKDLGAFGVRAIAAAPADPSRLVAGTQHGVMQSTDSGKTWKRISDPQNLEMQGITAIAIDPKDANIIFAGTSHLPWRTMDGGKTWDSIHNGMIDDSDVFSIYIDPANPTDVYASACSGIYASSDRGAQWHKLMGIPNTSRRTHVVRWEAATCCGDPSIPGAVYAGTTTGLFRSLNRGVTWKTLGSAQVNALAFDPAQPSTMYLALEYEGIAKSTNGGASIELTSTGFVDRVVTSASTLGKRLIAVEPAEGESSGLFFSDNAGDSWYQLQNVRGLDGVHINQIAGTSESGKTLLASSPHQIYKSVDSGASWKPLPIHLIVPPPPEPKPAPTPTRAKTSSKARTRPVRPAKPRETIRNISPSEISHIYSFRSSGKDIFLAATDLGLLRSTDLGERWTSPDLGPSVAVTAVYVSPKDDGRMIARTSGGLFQSKDCGDHWSSLQFPLPVSDVNDISLPPDASAPILVATRVGLYASVDEGGRWSANASGIPASTVASVLYSNVDRTAYAVEYGRLYQTRDGGATWNELPSSLSSVRIRHLWMPDAASGRIYGITSDLGIIFRN